SQRDALAAEERELSASASDDASLMPDADLAAKAMQRQREMAEAAADVVQSEDSAIGQLTAGVLRLCASAFPKAIGAKLVIEKNDSDTVDIYLPVCRPVIAATDTHTPQQTPRQTRTRFRAWWARILEEVHAVETDLNDSDSPLAKSLAPRVAHDLSLKLSRVWHEMAVSMVLESPTEFPEIISG
ncbi:MAG: hypothetical protein C0467_31100, partial [Planctomycetaceae bacterium]|nr:hypothetical protein [Planctomycetaceae bacterium]